MVNEQGFQFLVFILDGIIIGILFDIFRVLRKSFKTKDYITNIEDIIFWILVGIIFMYSMYNYCGGELRLYMLLGILWGISIYIVLLSKYFINISVNILNIFKKVIYFPIKMMFKWISLVYNKVLKIVFKITKILIFRPINFLYKIIRENAQKNIKILSKNQKKRGDFYNKRRNI